MNIGPLSHQLCRASLRPPSTSSAIISFFTCCSASSTSALTSYWPSSSLSSSASSSSSCSWPHGRSLEFRRHQSTYRRTRKKLIVKPAASFLQRGNGGIDAVDSPPQQDHIIFNPPSSAPSVYHTPLKFLPKDDVRRTLLAKYPAMSTTPSSRASTATSAGMATSVGSSSSAPISSLSSMSSLSSTSRSTSNLPPALRNPYQKKYHMTEADIAEVQRLKREDPAKWTRLELARKFDCSDLFIAMVCEMGKCPTDPVLRQQWLTRRQAAKAQWGPKRRKAREDRAARKRTWGRGDD